GGQHTLLHGEALLVVGLLVCHAITLNKAYLPLISQRVSRHLSGHSLLIEGTFWQPVAGYEMFTASRSKTQLKKYDTFILPNRPSDGPPRKRDRISASWSHIDLKCYRDNWFAVNFNVIQLLYYKF
uniref:Uncharacterized protein n=1 Tax=Amphilophus citrinellus TaxID=61819 RepID=A0A3Q0QXM7_AMPCI